MMLARIAIKAMALKDSMTIQIKRDGMNGAARSDAETLKKQVEDNASHGSSSALS